jgi:hypothetical protein
MMSPLDLGISQSVSANLKALLKKVSNSLQAFPKESSIPFGAAQMVSTVRDFRCISQRVSA